MNKFRVWYKNNNEWEKNPCFLSQDGIVYQQISAMEFAPCTKDTHVVQFCTTFKDEDKKEIYEGDICQGINKLYLCHRSEEKSGYYFKVIKSETVLCRDLSFPMWQWSIDGEMPDIKVVGNIFKNPELLQNTNKI